MDYQKDGCCPAILSLCTFSLLCALPGVPRLERGKRIAETRSTPFQRRDCLLQVTGQIGARYESPISILQGYTFPETTSERSGAQPPERAVAQRHQRLSASSHSLLAMKTRSSSKSPTREPKPSSSPSKAKAEPKEEPISPPKKRGRGAKEREVDETEPKKEEEKKPKDSPRKKPKTEGVSDVGQAPPAAFGTPSGKGAERRHGELSRFVRRESY